MYDDEFDDGADEEFDDEFDNGFDDAAETLPCPHCGAHVYEDAPQCPHCGNYITTSSSVWSGRPWWWIALGVLGVAAAICALLAL